MFSQIKDFPAFLFQTDLSQLLHLGRLVVKRLSKLFQVEVNCNFLVVKDMVKDKEVVNAHVGGRINQAVYL
jgi:hypothetical protein